MKTALLKTTPLLAALALSACQTATEALDVDEVRKSELVETECAVYFAAQKQLQAAGRTANGNMTEGCPPTAANISVDIRPNAGTPSTDSRFATIIFQRMIARGMPRDLADEIRQSPTFFELVTQSDALYGG